MFSYFKKSYYPGIVLEARGLCNLFLKKNFGFWKVFQTTSLFFLFTRGHWLLSNSLLAVFSTDKISLLVLPKSCFFVSFFVSCAEWKMNFAFEWQKSNNKQNTF